MSIEAERAFSEAVRIQFAKTLSNPGETGELSGLQSPEEDAVKNILRGFDALGAFVDWNETVDEIGVTVAWYF